MPSNLRAIGLKTPKIKLSEMTQAKDMTQAKTPSQIAYLKNLTSKEVGLRPVQRLQLIFETTLGAAPGAEPPVQYRVNFTKYVIKQWGNYEKTDEDDEDALEEAISLWYDALEKLASLKSQTEPFYRLYNLVEGQPPIKIYENEGAFVAEGTTGLVTWEASLELAKWLKSSVQKAESAFKTVNWILELGCGCGFLAVFGLKLFPRLKKYIATDGSFSALEKCRENYAANFSDTSDGSLLQFEQLDWISDVQKYVQLVQNITKEFGPGLLIGADIVFDATLIPSLVNLLNIFLEKQKQLPSPGFALLSCTVRNEATVEVLKTELENRKPTETATWPNGMVLEIK